MIIEKPLKINTITATSNLNTGINLLLFFENVEIDENVTYIETGVQKKEITYKGYSKKYYIKRRKNRILKRFDNQVTIIYKNINIKIFQNGKLHLTGLKNIEQIEKIIKDLINIIKDIYKKNKDIVNKFSDLKYTGYSIHLINADYKIDKNIDREKMFKILKKDYKLVCYYEGTIYPGLKIYYFDNNNKKGICKCETSCLANSKNNNCDKITLLLFRKGNIIITGAKNLNQINECYDFMNNIFKKLNF